MKRATKKHAARHHGGAALGGSSKKHLHLRMRKLKGGTYALSIMKKR